MLESLENVIGRKLTGFRIQKMTKVYRLNGVGGESEPGVLFIRNCSAKEYVARQQDLHATTSVFVLTDGKVGFVIQPESTTMFGGLRENLGILGRARRRRKS